MDESLPAEFTVSKIPLDTFGQSYPSSNIQSWLGDQLLMLLYCEIQLTKN